MDLAGDGAKADRAGQLGVTERDRLRSLFSVCLQAMA
jgi:hypothetical protein